MRRRWRVNTDWLVGLGVAWFAIGLIVLMVAASVADRHPHRADWRWLIAALWLGPFALCGVITLAPRAWRATRANPPIKREWVISPDIRERHKVEDQDA